MAAEVLLEFPREGIFKFRCRYVPVYNSGDGIGNKYPCEF